MKIKLKQDSLNSSIQFIVSFIFVLMGIWFYFDKLSNKPQIDMFDWAYIVFFIGLFVFFFIKGIIGIIKYPFIELNTENITYLPEVNDFSTVLKWENITKIEITTVSILFHKKAGQPFEFYLNKLSDKIEFEFVNKLKELAYKQNITVIDK